VCRRQPDDPDVTPMTKSDTSSPGVVVQVVRKSGTALGMSIAGGLGSVPFIGGDEVGEN